MQPASWAHDALVQVLRWCGMTSRRVRGSAIPAGTRTILQIGRPALETAVMGEIDGQAPS